VPVRVPGDTATDTDDTTDTAGAGTDTAWLPSDTATGAADTFPVSFSAPADTATEAADTFDTAPDTARPLVMPETGGKLSDAELDAVVVLLIRETDPPRSYRQMEDRFRELGYSASAARLRAAWGRVATPIV
jgi:hypothetical protein